MRNIPTVQYPLLREQHLTCIPPRGKLVCKLALLPGPPSALVVDVIPGSSHQALHGRKVSPHGPDGQPAGLASAVAAPPSARARAAALRQNIWINQRITAATLVDQLKNVVEQYGAQFNQVIKHAMCGGRCACSHVGRFCKSC
jgi:hypothetical protein